MIPLLKASIAAAISVLLAVAAGLRPAETWLCQDQDQPPAGFSCPERLRLSAEQTRQDPLRYIGADDFPVSQAAPFAYITGNLSDPRT